MNKNNPTYNIGQNFVAIDIECGVNYWPYTKMCAYAYVMTDSKLNILDKKEQLIKCPIKGRVKDIIKIDKEAIVNAPQYKDVYPMIRENLTMRDTIYLAHSAEYDMVYIINDNKTNGLPGFDFKIYDTLKIVKNYAVMEKYGLEIICAEWNIEHDPHECLSDANACIEIIRHISEKEDITPYEVIQKYGKDALLDSKKLIADNERRVLNDKLKKMCMERPRDWDLPFHGMIACFSNEFLDECPDYAMQIVKSIISNGGSYTDKPKKCNLFLSTDGSPCEMADVEDKKPNLRIMSVDNFISENGKIFFRKGVNPLSHRRH